MIDKVATLVLAVGLWGACVYFWATGAEPPAILLAAAGAAAGRFVPSPGALGAKAKA